MILGIDGGGSRSCAVLADETGQVLGRGTSGPGNYHNLGVEAVKANLAEAVRQAWRRADLAPRRADAAFFGLGSIVCQEDRDVIHGIAEELEIAPKDAIGVDHDLRVALAGGLAGRPGIVLIAGTGSSCYGRTEDARCWRAGGWGPVLDDRGSGYDLGRRAMIAAVRDLDGRLEPTVLRQRVLDVLGLDDMQKIMFRVDGQGLSRREIAALACMVTAAAEQGDAVARAIIHEGADQLALMIRTVADALFADGDEPVRVTTAGGLMQAGPVVAHPLHEAVARRAPRCRIEEPVLPPELGALLLARELLGLPPEESVVRQLAQSTGDAGLPVTQEPLPAPHFEPSRARVQ